MLCFSRAVHAVIAYAVERPAMPRYFPPLLSFFPLLFPKMAMTQLTPDVQELVDALQNPHRIQRHNSLTTARPSYTSSTGQRSAPDSEPSPSVSVFDAEAVASRRLLAIALNDLLWDVFNTTFESRFAIWFGDSCCPYLKLSPVSLRCNPVLILAHLLFLLFR